MKSWHVPALIQYLTQQHEKLWRGSAVLAAWVRILIAAHSWFLINPLRHEVVGQYDFNGGGWRLIKQQEDSVIDIYL